MPAFEGATSINIYLAGSGPYRFRDALLPLFRDFPILVSTCQPDSSFLY